MHAQRFAAAAVAAVACCGAAHAAPLPTDGTWMPIDVDELSAVSGGLEWIDVASGAPLSLDFQVDPGHRATLTVVDAGFAGDRFVVMNGKKLLGATSLPQASYPDSVGLDFDAALGDARYSFAHFTLGKGTYSISGLLSQSANVDGMPLNATVGGVRVAVSAVPEPETISMLVAGLLAVAAFVRNRRDAA